MMYYSRKFRWLLITVVVAALPASARADAPVGQFNLQFLPSQGIWNVTGNYPSFGVDVITNDINLIQDEKGKITGTGTGTGTDQGITVDLVYNITGSIKAVDDVTRVLLTLKVSGTATDGFVTLPVSGSIKLTLDLDKPNNILIGSSAARLCARGAMRPSERAGAIRHSPKFSTDGRKLGASLGSSESGQQKNRRYRRRNTLERSSHFIHSLRELFRNKTFD